jgi:hypothetical protein
MAGMQGGTRIRANRFRERTFAGNYFCAYVLQAAVRCELDQDVAPGSVGVGAGAVGIGYETFGSGLIETGNVDIERDCEGEAIVPFGGADGDFGIDGDVAGPELLLHGLILHRADEAGRVTSGEELFGIGAGFAAAAERGRCGEVKVNATVGAADVAVAAILRGHFCGVERLDESEHRVWGLLDRATCLDSHKRQEDDGNDRGVGMALIIDRSFPATWTAEVLATRPPILPRRHFVFPAEVEEVERGALELMVRLAAGEAFLATCALGFASPAVPTGVWSCPDPALVCAVAGGYGYMIDSGAPERWQQIGYRPVTEVRPIPEAGLLVFASFHSVEAWGPAGRLWRTARLSWEGVRLGEASAKELHGWGWEMRTDTEIKFVVDLATGKHMGGAQF